MTRLRLLSLLLILAASRCSAQLVPPITAECATSIDGSIVGTPNPLQHPVVSAVYSGTLPSGTYWVQEAWVDAVAHTTLVSPEVSIQLSGTGQIQELPPLSGLPATEVSRSVYIGATSGSETLQGSITGSGTYIQSVPLVSGAAPPAVNNTVCQVIANDAGWPTGTGYDISLTTPAGGTMPGYPMQWQLLGPGTTINVSQGLPLYNGTVTYPIPILARPYNHGPQSISGPLSMTNYNIVNVGRLGVGTPVPAWGVDAEGSGIQGAINANTGYLFNGFGPLNHVLLGNGSYYVDSATIPWSIITGAPTIYYQTFAANGVAQTQRPTANFSPYFSLNDSASPAETTVAPVTTGTEGKLVTAAAAGTSGNCAQWDASSGVSDAGFPCSAPAPLYTASGTLVTNFHYVSGTCTTDGGTCDATFSGAAAFTSAATYSCQATKVGPSSGITNVILNSGTSVTFEAGGGQQIFWYCYGN